jgi:hypothetical protein
MSKSDDELIRNSGKRRHGTSSRCRVRLRAAVPGRYGKKKSCVRYLSLWRQVPSPVPSAYSCN